MAWNPPSNGDEYATKEDVQAVDAKVDRLGEDVHQLDKKVDRLDGML